MRPLRAVVNNRHAIFLITSLFLSLLSFLPLSFAFIVPVDDPPPAEEKTVEPAPAEDTKDLFVEQAATPASPASGVSSTPEASAQPEAPAFEAPASSEKLMDQFES